MGVLQHSAASKLDSAFLTVNSRDGGQIVRQLKYIFTLLGKTPNKWIVFQTGFSCLVKGVFESDFLKKIGEVENLPNFHHSERLERTLANAVLHFETARKEKNILKIEL